MAKNSKSELRTKNEICKMRKEYNFPCHSCIYFENCDNANDPLNFKEYRRTKEKVAINADRKEMIV